MRNSWIGPSSYQTRSNGWSDPQTYINIQDLQIAYDHINAILNNTEHPHFKSATSSLNLLCAVDMRDRYEFDPNRFDFMALIRLERLLTADINHPYHFKALAKILSMSRSGWLVSSIKQATIVALSQLRKIAQNELHEHYWDTIKLLVEYGDKSDRKFVLPILISVVQNQKHKQYWDIVKLLYSDNCTNSDLYQIGFTQMVKIAEDIESPYNEEAIDYLWETPEYSRNNEDKRESIRKIAKNIDNHRINWHAVQKLFKGGVEDKVIAISQAAIIAKDEYHPHRIDAISSLPRVDAILNLWEHYSHESVSLSDVRRF